MFFKKGQKYVKVYFVTARLMVLQLTVINIQLHLLRNKIYSKTIGTKIFKVGTLKKFIPRDILKPYIKHSVVSESEQEPHYKVRADTSLM